MAPAPRKMKIPPGTKIEPGENLRAASSKDSSYGRGIPKAIWDHMSNNKKAVSEVNSNLNKSIGHITAAVNRIQSSNDMLNHTIADMIGKLDRLTKTIASAIGDNHSDKNGRNNISNPAEAAGSSWGSKLFGVATVAAGAAAGMAGVGYIATNRTPTQGSSQFRRGSDTPDGDAKPYKGETTPGDLSDINPNQLAFLRGIGQTETGFSRDEAYSEANNQPHNNANVKKYGQKGADYGYYQTNQRDVEDAIRLGVPPEVAKHLHGGGKGGTSSIEEQTRAMHAYLQKKYPNEYGGLTSGSPEAFEKARESMQNQWFGLKDKPDTAREQFKKAQDGPEAIYPEIKPDSKEAKGSGTTPKRILDQAQKIAESGDPDKVEQFMQEQGYPKNGAWCGEFTASVVKAAGGTPPENPEVASNWRKTPGTKLVTGEPMPGDIAVKKPEYHTGLGSGETGDTGSHVGVVKKNKGGTIEIIGGNQASGIIAEHKKEIYDYYRMIEKKKEDSKKDAKPNTNASKSLDISNMSDEEVKKAAQDSIGGNDSSIKKDKDSNSASSKDEPTKNKPLKQTSAADLSVDESTKEKASAINTSAVVKETESTNQPQEMKSNDSSDSNVSTQSSQQNQRSSETDELSGDNNPYPKWEDKVDMAYGSEKKG